MFIFIVQLCKTEPNKNKLYDELPASIDHRRCSKSPGKIRFHFTHYVLETIKHISQHKTHIYCLRAQTMSTNAANSTFTFALHVKHWQIRVSLATGCDTCDVHILSFQFYSFILQNVQAICPSHSRRYVPWTHEVRCNEFLFFCV